jgi:hypothetical protein
MLQTIEDKIIEIRGVPAILDWQNDIFRLEVEEIVGNENSLDLGSSVSVTRRFQVRQVEQECVEFEPIP